MTKHLYPRASEIVMKDLYVDDCLSGENMCEDVQSTTEQLKLVLEKGGFTLKAFTISGSDPINRNELNFAKKIVGRKLSKKQEVILENLKMRDCWQSGRDF